MGLQSAAQPREIVKGCYNLPILGEDTGSEANKDDGEELHCDVKEYGNPHSRCVKKNIGRMERRLVMRMYCMSWM